MEDRRGFALIITLLVTALLVAVVTEFIREVYVESSLQRSFRDGTQASLMAESGVMGGIRLVQLALNTQTYSALTDAWKAKPLHMEDERGTIDVFIEEESGKLNLNVIAPPTGDYTDNFYYGVLTRLLKRLEMSEDLGDALVDWIDTNDEPHRAGAEATYYGRLVPPYSPRNDRLLTMEEMRLVKGVDEATYLKLRPFVTIYTDIDRAPAAPININTAPLEVLTSLDPDMSEELAKRIADRRKVEPFKSAADLVKVAGLEQIGMRLQTRITIKGAVYRLTSTAKIGETSRTIEAVVRLGGSQPGFLYWREY